MKPDVILADAQKMRDETIRLRRRIHRHPEIGLTLPRTQAAVLESLRGLGLDVRTGQRTTSVVARLSGARPGPTIQRLAHPVMGSEDFSYVLERVPGAMANVGTRPDSGPVFPNHSNRMLVNESALATGVAMHVAVALRFLETSSAAAP